MMLMLMMRIHGGPAFGASIVAEMGCGWKVLRLDQVNLEQHNQSRISKKTFDGRLPPRNVAKSVDDQSGAERFKRHVRLPGLVRLPCENIIRFSAVLEASASTPGP